MQARELPELADALRCLAAAQPGFADLRLGWTRHGGGLVQAPEGAPLPAPLEAAAAGALAMADGRPVSASDGQGLAVAWSLPATPRRILLVLRVQPGADIRPFGPVIESALALAGALVEKESLRGSIARTEQAERLQSALYSIAELAGSELEMPHMLAGIHQIIARLMYAENFFIVRYNRHRQALRFIYFADSLDPFIPDAQVEIPEGEIADSLTLAMIRHGRGLMGPSSRLREQLGLEPAGSHGPDSADWLGVPMLSGEDVRGAIVVQSYGGTVVFSEDDRVLLSFVAQHVLTALERRDARQELERRVAERTRELARTNAELRVEVEERQRAERLQAALFRIAELSMTSETPEAFYAAIHVVVGRLLYARNFFIALLNDACDRLEFPYSVDERDAHRPPRRLAHGLTEYVLRTRRPLLSDPARVRELVEAGEVRTSGAASSCWLGVPLMRQDVAVGVVVVQSYSERVRFTQRDQELLTFVAFHIASGLMRKRAQERLLEAYAGLERRVEERTAALGRANAELRAQIGEREAAEHKLTHLALHDSLTGLPNRTRFLERLQQSMQRYEADRTRPFAVLFLDLDRFKVVNDSVGHLIGDQLLMHAGTRISMAVPEPGMVARLGGDEFAVLLEDTGDEEGALAVGRNIIDALSAPIRIEGKDLFTSASIGVALADPGYRRAEELLRDADAAMYRAKASGRNTSEVFDARLRMEALRVLEIGSDLRRGLSQEDFVAYYQPIVDLGSGRTLGYEALLRWRHPERGMLPPAEFLLIAEESGLIEQIDWLIFEQAVAVAPRLCAEGGYVCINVSPRHLRSRQFVPRLQGLLERYGVAGRHLRVELTEGALLDASDEVLSTLRTLRQAGIVAQLDDFGTGYSALSYLHRFPIGALKIDRSFIAAIDCAPGEGGGGSGLVVGAILALASSLRLEVIAEGIETADQRDALQTLGCRFGQGFFFARPEALAEVAVPG